MGALEGWEAEPGGRHPSLDRKCGSGAPHRGLPCGSTWKSNFGWALK
jgi:hypothetical protein